MHWKLSSQKSGTGRQILEILFITASEFIEIRIASGHKEFGIVIAHIFVSDDDIHSLHFTKSDVL